jgi:multidrug efflux pump subunit AcrA (membrane-fusion protein)
MAELKKDNSDPNFVYSVVQDDIDVVYAKTPDEMLELHDLPDVAKMLTRLVIVFFLFITIFFIAIPWQQTATGSGKVIAYNPKDRVQNIHATVSGRVKKWYVQEGSYVKTGDPIIEITDIDPNYLERLKVQSAAVKSQYDAAVAVARTAKYDFERQNDLYQKGISSRKDMEQATIAFRNAEALEAQALSNYTQSQSTLSRQQSQLLVAPTDGTIVRLLVGSSNIVVDQGQVLAVFVPKSEELSVQIFIKGNDLPLVQEGRKVRLQFEGWPAIQFSGWPSVAIGTFGGEVKVVDQTATPDGFFRVIVVPGKGVKWPASRFIRQGTRVNGWILLNNVSIGYEAWRQFNGFPPTMDRAPNDGLSNSTSDIPE